MKNKETSSGDYVKRSTLVGSIIFALIIGFVGGAFYSSYKLAGQKNAPKNMTANTAQPQPGDDASVETASKIFEVEQYLKNHPKDGKGWAHLGNLFFDSDQYANAIGAYEKSLAIDPNQTGVLTDLGVMYRRNKQPQKAVESFDRAIAVDPKFETARFNKGIVLLHDLNDIQGGINAWEELIRVNPLALAPNGESVDALVARMKEQLAESEK